MAALPPSSGQGHPPGSGITGLPSPEVGTLAHSGMIVREAAPLNLEMAFGTLDAFITPTANFFVRCHFSVPEIARDQWRLRVKGQGRKPLELTWDDLRAMPTSTVTATLECAGNGRVFLQPKVDGAQWERGAVGNAVWTGVLLKEVLQRAGVNPSDREVILVGGDHGSIADAPRPGGEIHYARSLPVGKASDDTLLAWEMNGTLLTPAHGFPLRAVVPGWYGMASVKWLSEVILTEDPFVGYYQSVDYAYWDRTTGEPSLRPITAMQVKGQIARPGPAETVSAGQPYLVRGAAWSGDAEIVRVELSVDAGKRWLPTQLGAATDRYAWRLWEYEWQVPALPGKIALLVRATDSAGRTQPMQRDADFGSYMVNHVIGIDVMVVA